MKYLCLAYGDEEDWTSLSETEQNILLAQDEELRSKGHLVAAVQEAASVQVRDGEVSITCGPFGESPKPLAGFYIVSAADLNAAIQLVSNTPCARAGGAIEIRPVADAGEDYAGNA